MTIIVQMEELKQTFRQFPDAFEAYTQNFYKI